MREAIPSASSHTSSFAGELPSCPAEEDNTTTLKTMN